MAILRFVVAILFWLSSAAFAVSVSSFTPVRPPAIPLAVKSPYLSTWLSAGSDNGGYLAGQWSKHWAGQITGWAGLIHVDGKAFKWMGNPALDIPVVDQTGFSYTSTQSIFTMNVGDKVQMKITFLSPVNPDDLKRQSLTLSYMEVSVASLDGNTHDVQVYTDISAEWASGDSDAVAEWVYHESGSLAYHQVWRQIQIPFDENGKPDGNGMANWGKVYYATDRVAGLSVASGVDDVVRNSFVNNGKLDGAKDTNFRPIQQNWPVMGLAVDLGHVNIQPLSTLFTIGLLQQQAVQFLGANGLTSLPALWTTYFPSEESALIYFHNDFPMQRVKNQDLDAKVARDSTGVAGRDYLTITSLAVRQSFGATQFVGTQEKSYLFMKEISSNGNTQTVDVIFPLHPILLYMNANWLKLMLDPLFEQQESGHYPNLYSIHDLGAHYPNATGHSDGRDEEMPVEECGNMLIMSLAYAQRTGDVAYLNQHYQKLSQWTIFLVNDSLVPSNQLSTDDFAGRLANQTNLALKGIIGVGAMAEIARLTGNVHDAQSYTAISKDYIAKWQKLGISEGSPGLLDHMTLSYGDLASHGLLYNLWCDVELGLGLVPKEIYDMQSQFYPTQEMRYGVPLDTRHSYTKSDWEMFAAAASSSATRDMFVRHLAKWINETRIDRAYPDLYETTSGDFPNFMFVARPVMGGTFALLVPGPKKRKRSWKG